jgi:hypothetical protein
LDGGISFVNECLEYGYLQHPEYVRANTSKEALRLGQKGAAEYLKVREAFEQDKKEGKKGRATRQLIQSTYFCW